MATITVTTTADNGDGSLRQAISKAKERDTIKFAPSLANKTIGLNKAINFGKSLTIDGSDAPNLTLSGSKKTNILWFGVEGKNLTVRNLTFADSYFDKVAGGAIWAKDNSNVRVENSVFKNNVSDGAALHAQQGSNLTVINSTFDNNDGAKISDKSYSAGAISLFAYGRLTVKRSKFTNNKGFGGGAVRVTGSDAIIDDSEFLNNDSTPGANKGIVPVPGGGGALYLDGASIPKEPRFYKGPLKRDTEGGIVKITNSKFDGNRGAGEGGAIMFYGYNQDRFVMRNSEIINNEVIKNSKGKADGGGLWLMGDIDIKNTTIANNKSAKDGGGLWYWGERPANITNTTISGNKAKDNGGAIYNNLWASKTVLTSTTIKNNSAGKEAGAIYSKNNEKVTAIAARNSIFDNNTAGNKQQVNRRLIDYGNNLQSPNSGDPVTANVSLAPPKLGNLKRVDGDLVHPLKPGSPAIDAGTPKWLSAKDQRGMSRQDGNYDGKVTPDIGAYEVSATPKPQSSLLQNASNSGKNKNLKQVVLADNSETPQDFERASDLKVVKAQNEEKLSPNVSSDSNVLSKKITDKTLTKSGTFSPNSKNSSNPVTADTSKTENSQQLTFSNESTLVPNFGVNPKVELLDLRSAEADSLMQTEFFVNRAAAYDNTFGFYGIDDESGRIGNLSPEDPGYAKAAVKQRIDLSNGLPGGELIAPFLISDATAEEFLEQNPNNNSQKTNVAYFAFSGANPDKKDHIRLLKDNKIGFEDLYGLGDRSFNDLTVQVKFS
ncbi:MAG: right-handed parallel beta-helix repeat-containing protein [Cyanobacteria bacterium P01_A01_bin.84]